MWLHTQRSWLRKISGVKSAKNTRRGWAELTPISEKGKRTSKSSSRKGSMRKKKKRGEIKHQE